MKHRKVKLMFDDDDELHNIYSFNLTKFELTQKEPLYITEKLNFESISIHSLSDIVIEKDAELNVNGPKMTRFEYESDFDENGISFS